MRELYKSRMLGVIGLRTVWFSTGLIIVCFWFLLRSSTSLSETLSLSNHFPASTASPAADNKDAEKQVTPAYQPGDTIPASEWTNVEPPALPQENADQITSSYTNDILPGPPPPLGYSDTAPEDRPLILYAYSESPFARENLEFFLDHGMHSAADFVFILNGETDADKLIFPDTEHSSGVKREENLNGVQGSEKADLLFADAKKKMLEDQLKQEEEIKKQTAAKAQKAEAQQKEIQEAKAAAIQKVKEAEAKQAEAEKLAKEAIEKSGTTATQSSKEASKPSDVVAVAVAKAPEGGAVLKQDEQIDAEKAKAMQQKSEEAQKKTDLHNKNWKAGEAERKKEKLLHHLPPRPRDNVKILRRPNTCYDLGAHTEVLNSYGSGLALDGYGWFDQHGALPAHPSGQREPGKDEKYVFGPGHDDLKLRYRYKRYILMNASIRGPFMPTWSSSCWSDAYLNKITPIVKLVGMTYNCEHGRGHVQSMIWATDSVGLQELLKPEVIGTCADSMNKAIDGEIGATKHMRSQGYDVDVMLSVYQSRNKMAKLAKINAAKAGSLGLDLSNIQMSVKLEQPGNWWEEGCGNHGDFLKPVQAEDSLDGYYGTFVHPFETIFMKSHRAIEDITLDHLTEWVDGEGYESYDYCH